MFKYALFLNLFRGHDKRARQVPIGIFGMDTSLLSISKHKKIVLACMPVSSHLEAYAVVPFCPPFPEGGDQEGQRRAYVRGVAEMGMVGRVLLVRYQVNRRPTYNCHLISATPKYCSQDYS